MSAFWSCRDVSERDVQTSGGAAIQGNAHTAGGDLIGRDAPRNILQFTAPDSLAQNIYYVLLRIETKQDDQADRLTKLERTVDFQTEKIVGQAERLRGIETDIGRLKDAQAESKIDRDRLNRELEALKEQLRAGVQQIKGQVSSIPVQEPGLQNPKTWQWIGLGILAGLLLWGALPGVISQLLQFFQWLN